MSQHMSYYDCATTAEQSRPNLSPDRATISATIVVMSY